MFSNMDKVSVDEFNVGPNNQTNLESIFGDFGSDGNSSLTYTAPKQPKVQNKKLTGGTQTSSSSSPTVIIAKAVHTFKMVDKKYQSQGKMGAALLSGKSAEEGPYQLLLYRGKQQQVCVSRISRETNFLVQPKNYCTFYDSQGAVWSILFDSVLEMTEFTFHVALAKWRSGDSKSAIMFQDLWCPACEDPKPCVVAAGDSVELSFTLHTISSDSQGLEELQSVYVTVEGSGWTQGLVGMQPTAKRAIFLQPFMLGDLNPKEVVYNSPVILKLTMLNISKVQENPPPSMQFKEEHQITTKNYPKLNSEPPLGETLINNNISPKGSPKATKADLISRMARMGQALPFKTATPGISDSDETEDDRRVERVVVPKPRTRVQHSPALTPAPVNTVVAAAPSLPTSAALTQHPVPVQWASASYMGGSMYPVPQMQSPSEIQNQAQFNMFFSEVRTTNSELRMGMTRLTDKVDALQNKLHINSEKKPTQDISSVLYRLLENEQQLKDQLISVITALNNQVQQPLSQQQPSVESTVPAAAENCQRCMERDKSHELEKVKKLEEENVLKAAIISADEFNLDPSRDTDHDQQALIDDLKNQVKVEQDRANAANKHLSSLALEKESLAKELEKANSLIKELQNTTQEKQTCIENLEQTLKDNEVSNAEDMRRNLQEVLNPKPVIGEHIKKILNAVYKLVKLQFEPENKYDSAFIQSVLAETIKAVTLEYLENGNLLLAEQKQSPNNNMQVSQTQSAPVFKSEQKTDERNDSQYVTEDNQDGTELSAQISTSVNKEVSSTSKFTTPQETSAASLSTDSISIQNDSGGIQELNAVNTKLSSSDVEERSIKPPVEINSSVADSAEEYSDDVGRQPPPVPLFDEGESDDDWINF